MHNFKYHTESYERVAFSKIRCSLQHTYIISINLLANSDKFEILQMILPISLMPRNCSQFFIPYFLPHHTSFSFLLSPPKATVST